MKKIIQFGALALALTASSTFVSADTIQLGSFATGASSMGNANTAINYAGFSAVSTPSSGTNSTFALNPGSSWFGPVANSTWIGFNSTAGPIGTVSPALGYYTFTTTFTAAASGLYNGTLNILADDTAEVILNGSVLVPFISLGGDAQCADTGVTCRSVDIIALNGVSLLSGTNANTLTFVVQQAGTPGTVDPSGLDFNGSLTSVSTGSVPEPSTLMMLGTGLFGVATAMRRRIGL